MGLSLARRFVLGWGKLRRAYVHMFNRSYVRRNHARRSGECRRCGACCKLMFRCPYLRGPDGDTECVRHGARWENCRIFPVDERDLADRDLVSRNGACGYSFDPPMKLRRWIVLVLAALVVLGPGARAAESAREERPVALKGSFGSGRAPEGWRIDSGKWEPVKGGLRCAGGTGRLAAVLREDMLPVAGVDFRADVWATFDRGGEARSGGTARAPDVGVVWGDLRARVVASGDGGACEVTVAGEAWRSEERRLPAGRFRMEVALDGRLVTVGAGGGRAFAVRDVFGALSENAPREIVVTAAPGAVIHAVRLVTTPAGARAEELRRGDRAWRLGNRRLAAVCYSEALAGGELAAAARAEAEYKMGLLLEAADSPEAAAQALDRAQKLDSGGPWGERARVALGLAALEAGQAEVALAFARAAAKRAPAGIEDWARFRSLVSRARVALVESGNGPQATYALRRVAERLEWARAAPARTQWAWDEVAVSLDDRGWEAEAEAIRRRAMSVLGRRVSVPRGPEELVGGPAPGLVPGSEPACVPEPETPPPPGGEAE